MNHGNKINRLGRTTAHRRATLRNLASSLFVKGYVNTTKAKAKELRPYAEKLITKAIRANKATSISQRVALLRNIQAEINAESPIQFLIRVWGVLCMNRPGGYTRIIKMGYRRGDAAEMAMIGIVIDDSYVRKYNLFSVSFKTAFHELAKDLMMDIFPTKRVLREWTRAKMPNFQIESSSPRHRMTLDFKLSFSQTVDLGEAMWPVFIGKYADLPLVVEIDCPDDVDLEFVFNSDHKLKEIPIVTNRNNVFKTIFSPTGPSQTLMGKITLNGYQKKITSLAYCELNVYAPFGRIFNANLLLTKKS